MLILKIFFDNWPMSSTSHGTSSPHKNEVEYVAVGSRLIGCVCNIQIKKTKKVMILNVQLELSTF